MERQSIVVDYMIQRVISNVEVDLVILGGKSGNHTTSIPFNLEFALLRRQLWLHQKACQILQLFEKPRVHSNLPNVNDISCMILLLALIIYMKNRLLDIFLQD